jgi:hypothetical protein
VSGVDGLIKTDNLQDVLSLEGCIGMCLAKPSCEGGRYNPNHNNCRLVRYNMNLFNIADCDSGKSEKKKTQFFVR